MTHTQPAPSSQSIHSSVRAEAVHAVLERKGGSVWSIEPEATVYEAVAKMDEKQVGALVVVSDGRLAGIVSERDYARRVILKGRMSRETRVEEIMTGTVLTVSPLDDVAHCMRVMTEHRVRHLPVLDEHGELVGIISIGDLVRSLLLAQAEALEQLTAYIGGKYPA